MSSAELMALELYIDENDCRCRVSRVPDAQPTHSSISDYLEKALDTTRQTKFRSAGRSLSEDSALERCLP